MADPDELLRRFQPRLRYDSQEAFFADSAAEWTDNPGNELRRRFADGKPGALIAATDPAAGEQKLTLGFLDHPLYADGETKAEDEDLISSPRRDYRRRYAELRMRPGYANVMYGRAKLGSDERLWLQYWLWYFYNDLHLAGGAGLHEGDWEMVQLRLGPGGERPDLAVYAQHTHAGQAAWEDVEKEPGQPDSPLIYVGRGSHASYFRAGYQGTGVWYDLADGKRPAPPLRLEILGDDDLPGWVRWRGRWGDTQPRIPGLHQPSPPGPVVHQQWDDPALLVADAVTVTRSQALPAPEVRIDRRSGRMRVRFDFSARAGQAPERLVITVNSKDDRLPPRTYTFALEHALRGGLDTGIELAEGKHYDVYVSTVGTDGRPSESRLVLLDPKPGLLARLAAVVPAIVARLRGDRRSPQPVGQRLMRSVSRFAFERLPAASRATSVSR